eukprot:gene9829-20443_t
MDQEDESLKDVIYDLMQKSSSRCVKKIKTVHDLKTKLSVKLEELNTVLSTIAEYPTLEGQIEDSSRKIGHCIVSINKCVLQLESINTKMDNIERRIDNVTARRIEQQNENNLTSVG